MYLKHFDSNRANWYFNVSRELCSFLAWVLRRNRWGVQRAADRLERAESHYSENRGNLCYLDAVEQLKTFKREAQDREQKDLEALSKLYGSSFEAYRAASDNERFEL